MTSNVNIGSVKKFKNCINLRNLDDDLFRGIQLAAERNDMAIQKFVKMLLCSYVDDWELNDENIRKFKLFNQRKD